jgi:hypothetical protein
VVGEDVPAERCPKLIETYRSSTRGRSNKELVGEYFELLTKIEKAGEKGNKRKLVQYCMMSLPLIEPLILSETTAPPLPAYDFVVRTMQARPELSQAEVEKLCGLEPSTPADTRRPFRIKIIPAIQELSQIWGQQNNRAQPANLRELVWYFPELAPWRNDIEDAERVIELRPRFEQYFREHTTCLRKDLPKAFPDLRREVVLRVVDDLEEAGVLQTGKEGRFVSVFAAQENPGGTDAGPQP